MIRKQSEGIEWLEFELFADHPHFAHGIFLKPLSVGISKAARIHADKSENDAAETMKENRLRIQKILRTDRLISAYQVHGTSIVHVTEEKGEIPHCDGLLTCQKGVGLMIKHADCQAAIFFDPEHKAIANVHCGWRGNVKNLYGIAVLEMQKQFASRPENILVGISPSLGPEKAEFIHYRTELPESFWPYQVKPTYFDLWAISRMQLEGAGILPHHIEIASLCTYSNARDFFSYRRDNRMTGNHAAIVLLR